MEGVRRAFSREDWRSPEMMAARRLLRSALDDKREASLEEQRRIAENPGPRGKRHQRQLRAAERRRISLASRESHGDPV